MNLTDFRATLKEALDPDLPEPDKTALLNLGPGRYMLGSYGGRGYPRCPLMAALESDDVAGLSRAHICTVNAIDKLLRERADWSGWDYCTVTVTA